jgi:hypothetical protein
VRLEYASGSAMSRVPLMLRDAALRAAPQHEGESHALAFACAVNARQPPKAEMSRAPCVGRPGPAATRAPPPEAALILLA